MTKKYISKSKPAPIPKNIYYSFRHKDNPEPFYFNVAISDDEILAKQKKQAFNRGYNLEDIIVEKPIS